VKRYLVKYTSGALASGSLGLRGRFVTDRLPDVEGRTLPELRGAAEALIKREHAQPFELITEQDRTSRPAAARR
jgi:hypothetical protein